MLRTVPLLVSLLVCVTATAQPTREALVEEIRTAYRQFDFAAAELLAQSALEEYSDLTVDHLTEIHTILALISYSRGETGQARRQFITALQLSPDLELDPVLVSPKILDYFEIVKQDLQTSDAASRAAVRYMLIRDPRPDAALRSMVLPGWGQLYKGQSVKGWTLTGLWGLSVAGGILSHLKRGTARDAYLAEDDPDRVGALHDEYNRWHRMRNGFIQAAAAVWVVSYVDALVFGRPQEEGRAFSLSARPAGAALTVQIGPSR